MVREEKKKNNLKYQRLNEDFKDMEENNPDSF